MCRGLHAFHMATPARQLFRTDPGLRFVLLEINQFLATLPGVHQVFCSLEAQAEVAIRRLMAMRCGLDQGGRVRVPYISVFDEAEQAAPVSSVVA
jgi:hypothetical protein